LIFLKKWFIKTGNLFKAKHEKLLRRRGDEDP